MIQLKSHLQTISDLRQSIANMRNLAEELPDCTDKGYLLATVDAMQKTLEDYADNTVDLYEKIMNFAIGASV